MDAHRRQLLVELREAVLSAGFSFQMAETVVEVNQDLEVKDLETLVLKYENHADEAERTAHLVQTYNRVAAEGMEKFKEKAIDIVDDYLREWAREQGEDYEPPPNPYRR